MKYKLLFLDVDGTLRPSGQPVIPKENVKAIAALQKAGVKVAIATGRGFACVPKLMLNGIKPDYWVASSGAEVRNAKGELLYGDCMTSEEMYALVDYFEDHSLPLRFIFSDASYAYLEYDYIVRREREMSVDNNIADGEDQDRHLVDMPYTAFGYFPPNHVEQFQQKYGYLNLRFLASSLDGWDIIRASQDKITGVRELCKAVGIPMEEAAAMGDGDNDVEMLREVGFGIAMANGTPAALAAANKVGLSAAEFGVAAGIRELWPEVFAQ